MRHRPFQSSYVEDFEVVEQRDGKLSRFPHTDQLPKLLRALSNEFYLPLPPRIQRVDERGDGFHKFMLHMAAMMFCDFINGSRKDRLRLFPLLGPDLVARIAIVQQVTEDARLGLFHRFKFYAGDDFFPEIYLSGKRLAFSDHLLKRFSERVPNNIGEDLSNFLFNFYSQPLISIIVGGTKTFVLGYRASILGFTCKESPEEFFLTTCLTAREMNSVDVMAPVDGYNFHYHMPFVKPRVRNWSPFVTALKLHERWEDKTRPPAPHPPSNSKDWCWVAAQIKDLLVKQGHGPGTTLSFVDDIPGPALFPSKPGETPGNIDEIALYKARFPEHDWDAIFASEQEGVAG